jgi:hypothetical protein
MNLEAKSKAIGSGEEKPLKVKTSVQKVPALAERIWQARVKASDRKGIFFKV